MITGTQTMRPTIALAEDDRNMRNLVAEALRADGYRVIELADGYQLVAQIARQQRLGVPSESVDLIVSDIRMPMMNGLAILKMLREARCETPVILMTAFGDEATRSEATRLGARLLDKPFKLDELRREVRSILAKTAADRG